MIEAVVPWRSLVLKSTDLTDAEHVGDGANAHTSRGIGCIDLSGGTDADLHLEFEVPDQLPKGTAKLRLRAIADAVTGNAKLLCKWGLYTQVGGDLSDPSSGTLNDETSGGAETLTWTSKDDDAWKTKTITLDAVSIGLDDQGKLLIVHLTFDVTGWTLAEDSVWLADLVWES